MIETENQPVMSCAFLKNANRSHFHFESFTALVPQAQKTVIKTVGRVMKFRAIQGGPEVGLQLL